MFSSNHNVYVYKKKSELNSADKLASHVKKMTLMKFKNFIIYWVYNWEKNKIHIFYNIEINEKLMKKNEFILISDKRLNT